MSLYWILPIIVFALCAHAGYTAAQRKGRDYGYWAIVCFLFPVLILLLELLPSQRGPTDEKPSISLWRRVLEWVAVYVIAFVLVVYLPLSLYASHLQQRF